jgi:hypothetical protein
VVCPSKMRAGAAAQPSGACQLPKRQGRGGQSCNRAAFTALRPSLSPAKTVRATRASIATQQPPPLRNRGRNCLRQSLAGPSRLAARRTFVGSASLMRSDCCCTAKYSFDRSPSIAAWWSALTVFPIAPRRPPSAPAAGACGARCGVEVGPEATNSAKLQLTGSCGRGRARPQRWQVCTLA